MLNIAILDDYTEFALRAADWSQLPEGSKLTVFNRPLSQSEAITALVPFDVLCTIRERMPLPRALIDKLPNLKLIVTVGTITNLDMAAARARGIKVVSTRMQPSPNDMMTVSACTPELTWALLMCAARSVAQQDRRIRAGGWQSRLGLVLAGRTLGLLGLGNIGKRMARYAHAFDMNVIAWSQNLTPEGAAESGVRRVDKEDLFSQSDIISVHLQLSDRTRGLVGAHELGLMKREALLINTSRGPIVDETALISALTHGIIAGAGLDVFDHEPLPAHHPLRLLDNVTLTPHLGYATPETFTMFISGMPETIATFAASRDTAVDSQ